MKKPILGTRVLVKNSAPVSEDLLDQSYTVISGVQNEGTTYEYVLVSAGNKKTLYLYTRWLIYELNNNIKVI